ncbi:MAG: nitrogen fixation protein NifX [Synechococcales bacterium]|nr:nitrogen fixation protein NifX [Synechococcales bacterium]
MKIAFATSDNIHVNAHFGSASMLDIYQVDPAGHEFVKTIKFGGNLNEDGNEDKLQPKIDALEDCTIVYVSTIGGSAATRLIKHKITPLKTQSDDKEITDVLTDLVKTLNGTPPPWLRKALQQRNPVLDDLDEDLDP